MEEPKIEQISSATSEETEAERNDRHIREEGQHIREFMLLQKDFILRLMQKSRGLGEEGADTLVEKTDVEIAADFDNYFVKNWGSAESDKFRTVFRAIRDEEENRHEDLWLELKNDMFRESLLRRIEEDFEKGQDESMRMAA